MEKIFSFRDFDETKERSLLHIVVPIAIIGLISAIAFIAFSFNI